MQPEVEIFRPPRLSRASGRLACLLGSFDPVHRGHQFMMRELLRRADALLVLLPARHFDKEVVPGKNAGFEQRLDMLRLLPSVLGDVIGLGLAHEVLFLRLASALEQRFPGIELCFGMGNDTFGRLLDSASYYRRWGLDWNPREERALAALRKTAVVFGRSSRETGMVAVPDQLSPVSSTLVRARASELFDRGAGQAEWQRTLDWAVESRVVEYLAGHGIYRGQAPPFAV